MGDLNNDVYLVIIYNTKLRNMKTNYTYTVNSRYLKVVGTIFYKFKLPEVQINLHFG